MTGQTATPTPQYHRPPFIAWLYSLDREDRVGDLARDVQADIDAGCMPRFGSLNAVRQHLEVRHDATDEVLETLDIARREHARVYRSAGVRNQPEETK